MQQVLDFIGDAPTCLSDQSDAAHPGGFPIVTTLYAWNTARAGSVAYPNVREARLFHPTRGRQFFDLGSIHLSPRQKDTPVLNRLAV